MRFFQRKEEHNLEDNFENMSAQQAEEDLKRAAKKAAQPVKNGAKKVAKKIGNEIKKGAKKVLKKAGKKALQLAAKAIKAFVQAVIKLLAALGPWGILILILIIIFAASFNYVKDERGSSSQRCFCRRR